MLLLQLAFKTDNESETIHLATFSSGRISVCVCEKEAEGGEGLQGADNCALFDCQRLKEVHRCGGHHVADQLLLNFTRLMFSDALV